MKCAICKSKDKELKMTIGGGFNYALICEECILSNKDYEK